MHIVRNYLDHNKTSNSYKWSEGEPEKVQPQLHGGPYKPQHKHPQTFVEFDSQSSATKEFQFLVHSHIYGDNACRPILKVQLFPGEGKLGERYIYDFNEPLHKKMLVRLNMFQNHIKVCYENFFIKNSLI